MIKVTRQARVTSVITEVNPEWELWNKCPERFACEPSRYISQVSWTAGEYSGVSDIYHIRKEGAPDPRGETIEVTIEDSYTNTSASPTKPGWSPSDLPGGNDNIGGFDDDYDYDDDHDFNHDKDGTFW